MAKIVQANQMASGNNNILDNQRNIVRTITSCMMKSVEMIKDFLLWQDQYLENIMGMN